MIRLSRHILSLLRSYDKVAIPGLGFFALDYVPASFNFESLEVTPPYFRLQFFNGEYEDGHLLADSYTRREGNGEKALEDLRKDIRELEDALGTTGVAFLPGIGNFLKGENELFFEAEYASNFHLPVLSLREDPVAEEAPAEESNSLEEEKEYTIPEGYRYHKPNYYYIPIHKTAANIAASLLLVLIVAAATLFPMNQPSSVSSTAYISPVKIAEKQEVQLPDSLLAPAPAVEKGYGDIAEKDDQSVAEKFETVVPQLEERAKDKCFAIVGAFKSMKKVDTFIAENSDGKNKLETVRNGKQILIYVASTATRDEMQKRLPSIRQQFPDAWIFEKK